MGGMCVYCLGVCVLGGLIIFFGSAAFILCGVVEFVVYLVDLCAHACCCCILNEAGHDVVGFPCGGWLVRACMGWRAYLISRSWAWLCGGVSLRCPFGLCDSCW